MKEKMNKKQLVLCQIEADIENINMRTKVMRMEAARRNIEVLGKDATLEIIKDKVAVIKKNLTVLNSI